MTENAFPDYPSPEFSEVKITDKRGGGDASGDAAPEQGTGTSVPAGIDPKESAPSAPVPSPHDLAVRAALESIDKLSVGDQFWVRDVKYRVLAIKGDQLMIQVDQLSRNALKKIRRVVYGSH